MRVNLKGVPRLSSRERRLLQNAARRRPRRRIIGARKRGRSSSWVNTAHRYVRTPIVSHTMPRSERIVVN